MGAKLRTAVAVAYCALALAACCLLAWAGGVLPAAGSQAGPAAASCPYAFVKVRATRWAWVRRTRRVHGHRVIVRRHGKPVYVRARVHYFKRKLEPVCPAAPPGALAANLSPGSSSPLPVGAGETSHLEYVADNGLISVYDLDHAFQLVKTISLPQTNAQVRGVTMAPSTHLLFVSFGGDGPANGSGNGSVLAYDLVAERLAWEVHLKTGIDSGQVSPDGSKLYMPTGENTPTGIWSVLSASNGEVLGAIHGGAGAHNTIASNDGRYVYLGGRNSPYLNVYETATGQVKAVGPLVGTVRPFTVNGLNTLAFTGATGFDGFQVSQITTGKVLFTVSFGAVPRGFPFTAPSHGISLSPDEKQLYVIDSVHKAVQFWDVSRVSEGVAPAPLAVLPVSGLSVTERPCAYDCGRSGWLQLSRDGRLLFVGDSGEVIDTRTRQVVTTLPTLAQTKKSIEVDWRAGVPVATSGRTGVGYVE